MSLIRKVVVLATVCTLVKLVVDRARDRRQLEVMTEALETSIRTSTEALELYHKADETCTRITHEHMAMFEQLVKARGYKIPENLDEIPSCELGPVLRDVQTLRRRMAEYDTNDFIRRSIELGKALSKP